MYYINEKVLICKSVHLNISAVIGDRKEKCIICCQEDFQKLNSINLVSRHRNNQRQIMRLSSSKQIQSDAFFSISDLGLCQMSHLANICYLHW